MVRRHDPSRPIRSRRIPNGCGATCCAASVDASRCSPTTPKTRRSTEHSRANRNRWTWISDLTDRIAERDRDRRRRARRSMPTTPTTLLRLAAVAAHTSGERTNAPLLCHVLGRAVALGAPLDQLALVVDDAAASGSKKAAECTSIATRCRPVRSSPSRSTGTSASSGAVRAAGSAARRDSCPHLDHDLAEGHVVGRRARVRGPRLGVRRRRAARTSATSSAASTRRARCSRSTLHEDADGVEANLRRDSLRSAAHGRDVPARSPPAPRSPARVRARPTSHEPRASAGRARAVHRRRQRSRAARWRPSST